MESEQLLLPDRTTTRRRATELTERKRAEEQLRKLAARVETIREEERTRIARDIHDELGQILLTLRLQLNNLFGEHPDHLVSDQVKLITGLIDKTLDSVHRICSELRPSLLDHLGLKAAVEWQAEDFEKRTGIACHLETCPGDITLGCERSTAVFRIFQELLTNVAKHSGATEIKVLLRQSREYVHLEVRDNGRGISGKQVVDSQSLGIMGMWERAALLGGRIKFKGVPGEGTTVLFRIPVK